MSHAVWCLCSFHVFCHRHYVKLSDVQESLDMFARQESLIVHLASLCRSDLHCIAAEREKSRREREEKNNFPALTQSRKSFATWKQHESAEKYLPPFRPISLSVQYTLSARTVTV